MTKPDITAIREFIKAQGTKANVRDFDKVHSGCFRVVFPHLRPLNGNEYARARDALLPLVRDLCRRFGLFNVLREQDITWTSFSGASIFLYFKLHGYRVAPQA